MEFLVFGSCRVTIKVVPEGTPGGMPWMQAKKTARAFLSPGSSCGFTKGEELRWAQASLRSTTQAEVIEAGSVSFM